MTTKSAATSIASTIPTVLDSDGDRYTFHRIGSTLYMVHPNGRQERVASYRDAVWKLGMQSNGSIPYGPKSFIRAWTAAVRHTFPAHTVGTAAQPATSAQTHTCTKCGTPADAVTTVNDRETCRDLHIPLGSEVCHTCHPS